MLSEQKKRLSRQIAPRPKAFQCSLLIFSPMKELSTLNTEEQYEEALTKIEALMNVKHPTQAQEDEQEALGRLVEAYKDEHYPIGLPDPGEAIRFRAEQEGKV